MTQSNHTPGPWLFDEDHINVVIESGQTVAARPDYSSLHSGTEEADMRLISAAPDLLDALDALVNSFEKHRPKEYWDAARAAIAKAKGQPCD